MTVVADYFTQLDAELEDSSSSGVWTSAQKLNWTNDAIRDFGERTRVLTDWQYANTVAGQMSYTLPDYTIEPIDVRLTYLGGVRTLVRQGFGKWSSLTASGTPCYYSYQDDALYLYPIPNISATVDFFRVYSASPVSSVTATASMPYSGKFDQALRDYVKARAYEQLQDFETASQFDNLYERKVNAADLQREKTDTKDNENTPRVVF